MIHNIGDMKSESATSCSQPGAPVENLACLQEMQALEDGAETEGMARQ